MKRYQKRERQEITAVQLSLPTKGFTYEKWGSTQRCKAGDWVVNNNGEIYTIDAETFEHTYREVSPGRYEKHAVVYAKQAEAQGHISTKEGQTYFGPGDWVVANDPEGRDSYAIQDSKFQEMYEPVA